MALNLPTISLRTHCIRLRLAARWPALLLLAALPAAAGCEAIPMPEVAVLEEDSPDWIQARLEAIKAIYNFTPEGERFLEEHEFRWMRGEPGWFGSFGYDRWTGVGESRLGPIMHELGHAYWGAFEVTGRADLSWVDPDGRHESTAILQLHADLIAFMAQPPDLYEPLRERLRNLPEVQLGDESGLLHFGEADLVHTTGGNLRLLPPLLRKYFDGYLTEGPFDSWYAALEWYQGLSHEDARAAAVYFGLDHLDFDLYRDLEPAGASSLSEGIAEVVEREEKQRLMDFALQFDAVTGLEEVDGRRMTPDLLFLRGYLEDKLALHRRYPGTLTELASTAAADLERVLDAFAELDGKQTAERADLLGSRMEEPMFSVFWPLVDGSTLMELHSRGITPRDTDPAERTTDGEIERLGRIAEAAATILRRARDDLDVGVRDLEALLLDVLERDDREAGMVIELALAADRELAETVVLRLDNDMVRALLAEEPGILRQLLEPERLLPLLGITADANADDLASGIRELMNAASGNYRTDRPYLSTVYELVAERGRSKPDEALEVMIGSGLFAEVMLRERPTETIALLSSDQERAAALIAGTTGYGRTPQALIHAIVYEDPLLAARLTDIMGQTHPEAARESLVQFAYDSHRKAALPSLRVSPENDGAFILALADLQGDGRVTESMADAVAAYRALVEDGTAPPDFLDAYAATLEEAAAAQDDLADGERLRRIVREAFALAGEG